MKTKIDGYYCTKGLIGDSTYDVIRFDFSDYRVISSYIRGYVPGQTFHLIAIDSSSIVVRSCYRGRKNYVLPPNLVFRFVNNYES